MGKEHNSITSITSITLPAHAKLNLALSVSGPRAADYRDEQGRARGGYHEIAGWFVPIGLADTVHLTRLGEGEASRFEVAWATDAPRPSAIDWPIEKDLVCKAHALLEREAGRRLPVEVRLEKRTPVGGGLGGGSSDGAAVLRGVNHLFQLGLSAARLREVSSELGSDVAFFVDEGNTERELMAPPRGAIVGGFGERIERVARPSGADVLLLFPPFGCATGAVYKAFDRAPAVLDARRVHGLIDESTGAGGYATAALFNDLTRAACGVEPRLGAIMERLERGGVRAHMTGSGSTLFVLEPGLGDAERVREACPELVVVESRIV